MQPILDDLLTEWQEAPTRSAEELCHNHPELLPQLREQIAILEQIQRLAAGAAVPFVPTLPEK